MLFNSFGYLFLFLPAVLLAVYLARRYWGATAAQVVVLIASLGFYASFRPMNLWHLGASILANWAIARQIGKAQQPARLRWLQFGLVANIGYLCAFKYINFLLGTLPLAHGHEHLIPDFEFPLGISFFTLTQIMYLVDCYESLLKPSSLFDHATFVSFFPYVLSGPLAKAKRMKKQFDHFGGQPGQRVNAIARGLFLFSMGLFKKTVCAQTFGQIADFGYNSSQHRSALEVVLFTSAYMMQLYFDFSGYSDMAIGSADMLGIQLPPNFDAPLRSLSIIEFWQRWHISLSGFITTYLYTPILRAMKRPTLAYAMLSTLIAMTIAGLWHGPSWTFVIFGLLHGIALATNSFWRKKVKWKLPKPLSWLLLIAFVDFAFLFFRSPNLAFAHTMLSELFTAHGAFTTENLRTMRANFSWPIFGPPMLLGLMTAFFGKSSEAMARDFEPRPRTALLCAGALVVACIFMNSAITASFIYFRF